MALDPQFAATVNVGIALVLTAETDMHTPAQSSLIMTAGANGTKIEEITIQAARIANLSVTTTAGLVYLYLYDGNATPTYHLFDTCTIRAIAGTSTTAPYHSVATDFASGSGKYTNLWMKSGWQLRASNSIQANSGFLKVAAFGADY